MTWRVEIPPPVENAIFDAALYIADDSVDGALAWVEQVHTAIDELGEAPQAATIDRQVSGRAGHTARRRAIGNYLVYYSVDEAKRTVVVEHFRHGARKPK